MLTKEEHNKLKEQGRTTIWFWGGKGFPLTRCAINEYDERFPECYFSTDKDALDENKNIVVKYL